MVVFWYHNNFSEFGCSEDKIFDVVVTQLRPHRNPENMDWVGLGQPRSTK